MQIGISVIIRDEVGAVIGTYCAVRNFTGCSFTAEAYGILSSAIFCKEISINQIVVEGDALQVVSKLRHGKGDWS